MKKRIIAGVLAVTLILSMTVGCGADTDSKTQETTSESETQSDDTSEGADMSQYADASEMTEVEDVVDPGMTPVYGDALNPGTYEVAMRSSSSMFKVERVELTVGDDGILTVRLHMESEAYSHIFPGTAEAAAAENGAGAIEIAEDASTGERYFEFIISGLDEGIPAAAFSVRKQKWYDRTLLFESSSLPDEAFKEKQFETVADLGLSDGEYTCEVTLSGGSGKASVESPSTITVKDGECVATIRWSSDKYDYMMVDDVRYEPVSTEGGSVFEIPVSGFDYEMPIQADTTAMSKPYLIDYTLNFSSSSIK